MTRLIWKSIVERNSIGFILAVAFLLRLSLIPLFNDDFNYWAYAVFGSFIIKGYNPYNVVSQDPTLLYINPWRYPPFYLLFTVPAILTKQFTGQALVYLAMLKVPLAISDIVSSFYIFKILCLRFQRSKALKLSTLYALNPVVVFVSSGGGWNDPIAIAFTVMSLYHFLAYQRSSQNVAGRELFKSALFLGLGVATKIYPIILVPVFMKEIRHWSGRLLYLILALVPIAAFSLPFVLWDFYSYASLLTTKNLGGQNPPFPTLGVSGIVGFLVAASLFLLLLHTYNRRISLTAKIVLVFLLVNIAIFGQTLNYMSWGIPFFTLFLAEHESKLRGLPFYPLSTFLGALIYNGIFNSVGGTTGLYYWMYHLLREEVVVPRAFPFVGYFGPKIPLLSTLITVYYFFSVTQVSWTNPITPQVNQKTERVTGPFTSKKIKFLLPILLLVLIILSWGTVAFHATFQEQSYPTIENRAFEFNGDFRSNLLNYQWAFGGGGTYSVNSSLRYIRLASIGPNATAAYVYRGGTGMLDGFHPSNSAVVHFRFRLENMQQSTRNMTLAETNGGRLEVVDENVITNFVYSNEVDNTPLVLIPADHDWHDFSIAYTQRKRIIEMDNRTWTLGGLTFTRLILGNPNSEGDFGRAQFSNVSVLINDFPTGSSSTYGSLMALVAPLLFIIMLFVLVNSRRGFRRKTSLIAGVPFSSSNYPAGR